MTKFTPGPWTLDDDAGIYADGVSVACVYGPDDFPCFDPATDNEKQAIENCNANGALIAAAPDLYNACKALQAEAAARNCGLRIADEAIAKAEGR